MQQKSGSDFRRPRTWQLRRDPARAGKQGWRVREAAHSFVFTLKCRSGYTVTSVATVTASRACGVRDGSYSVFRSGG